MKLHFIAVQSVICIGAYENDAELTGSDAHAERRCQQSV